MTAYLFAPLIQFVLSKILLKETLTPSFQSVSIILQSFLNNTYSYRGCPGSDHMVVGFTTTCAISAYHH